MYNIYNKYVGYLAHLNRDIWCDGECNFVFVFMFFFLRKRKVLEEVVE